MVILHINLVQLDHHPTKRTPLPYIYIGYKLSPSDNDYEYTADSNGLPPTWKTTISLPLPDVPSITLSLKLIESRLLMKPQEIGTIQIPIEFLPFGKVVADWIPVTPTREFIQPMRLLCFFHVASEEDKPFSFPFSNYVSAPEWEIIPVDDNLKNLLIEELVSCPKQKTTDINAVIRDLFAQLQRLSE